MGARISIAAGILWAAPWSLVGLLLGSLALVGRGRVHRSGRVIEFHGPLLAWILRMMPIKGGASAMTLGHVVIAADEQQLDRTREHERVHVGQYERWGLFFVPAYFAMGLALWVRGDDPYLDNPFEREAFDQTDGC
jgi:hypothetical protein